MNYCRTMYCARDFFTISIEEFKERDYSYIYIYHSYRKSLNVSERYKKVFSEI